MKEADMMLRCKLTQCPYNKEEFCRHRAPSINEAGECSFIFIRPHQQRMMTMEIAMKGIGEEFKRELEIVNAEDLSNE